jgi:hypothetical protein
VERRREMRKWDATTPYDERPLVIVDTADPRLGS